MNLIIKWEDEERYLIKIMKDHWSSPSSNCFIISSIVNMNIQEFDEFIKEYNGYRLYIHLYFNYKHDAEKFCDWFDSMILMNHLNDIKN